MIQLLMMVCSLLSLGSAWNQPNTCFVRPSACSGDTDTLKELREIREELSSVTDTLQEIGPLVEYCKGPIGSFENPATSCSEIALGKPSGDYWIQTANTSHPIQVYCDMERSSCNCNTTDTRGWMRVANLDMADPNQNCPEGFRFVNRTEPPLRSCGRTESCVSVFYSTFGVDYSHVCGRVLAYQDGSPDAFWSYFTNNITIDSFYVDGVSLTYGESPRQHIWTFAAARDETVSNRNVCPCTRADLNYTGAVPPFVGDDYFCETGSREVSDNDEFYNSDPLWDAQGCGSNSTCCQLNNPPWFCKQLPQTITDDIELRICSNQGGFSLEDTPIELVEIYVR